LNIHCVNCCVTFVHWELDSEIQSTPQVFLWDVYSNTSNIFTHVQALSYIHSMITVTSHSLVHKKRNTPTLMHIIQYHNDVRQNVFNGEGNVKVIFGWDSWPLPNRLLTMLQSPTCSASMHNINTWLSGFLWGCVKL